MFYGIDPLYYLLMAPVLLLSIYAQFKVKSNFTRFSNYRSKSALTGRDVAELILKKMNINDIPVERTTGWLSDHYSPVTKELKLSSKVYDSDSIAAFGIAAHEAGHALQHKEGMIIMRLWISMAKPVAFMGNTSIFLILIGSLMSFFMLAKIGLLFFLAVVVFQIITLPLEFDASNRAKKMLIQFGMINREELVGVKRVLDSAALTYVAAAAASLTQLIYFALRLGIFDRRR